MAMTVEIDFIPDRPSGVAVTRTNSHNQINIELPDVRLYLYQATAEWLRDQLVELLGPPDGYGKKDEALRDELVDMFGPPDGYVEIEES